MCFVQFVLSNPRVLGHPLSLEASLAMLLEDALRLLVLAQADKLRMSQPISLGPFEEFNLSDGLWPQPNCLSHFLGVEFLPKS